MTCWSSNVPGGWLLGSGPCHGCTRGAGSEKSLGDRAPILRENPGIRTGALQSQVQISSPCLPSGATLGTSSPPWGTASSSVMWGRWWNICHSLLVSIEILWVKCSLRDCSGLVTRSVSSPWGQPTWVQTLNLPLLHASDFPSVGGNLEGSCKD